MKTCDLRRKVRGELGFPGVSVRTGVGRFVLAHCLLLLALTQSRGFEGLCVDDYSDYSLALICLNMIKGLLLATPKSRNGSIRLEEMHKEMQKSRSKEPSWQLRGRAQNRVMLNLRPRAHVQMVSASHLDFAVAVVMILQGESWLSLGEVSRSPYSLHSRF